MRQSPRVEGDGRILQGIGEALPGITACRNLAPCGRDYCLGLDL
jgi:hypothetical protein